MPLDLTNPASLTVIAEIGVNHDGRVDRALKLVDAAHSAGADAVKLQVFRAEQLVHGTGILAEYQKSTTDAPTSADLLRRYELSEPDLRRVLDHARSLGLLTVATPFSLADVPVCSRLGLSAIKIASPDLVNHLLLKAVAHTRLPMLISTGAATLDEVANADRFLASLGFTAQRIYLHCVSAYPAPDEMAHLTFLGDLQRLLGSPVGYSDHAPSLLAGACAVAAGAVVLERHLTYDTTAAGPDHAASSDPVQFAEYVRLARTAQRLRGSGSKHVLPVEEDVRRVSRQSLVLATSLSRGAVLQESHLTTQRPGTGISPDRYTELVGSRLATDLPAGALLQMDHLLPRQPA